MEERKLKNTVTVEDIENLIFSFMSACRKDDFMELEGKLWHEFYDDMTELYVDGKLVG